LAAELPLACRACLAGVAGDQEDFADLIGARGELALTGPGRPGNRFFPDGRGDWLSMAVTAVGLSPAGRDVAVTTALGNTFTFRLAGPSSPPPVG
jgi:hypothetical protein